jgi:hypothetical protein
MNQPRILVIVNGIVLGTVGPAAADRWRELLRRAGLRVEVRHG